MKLKKGKALLVFAMGIITAFCLTACGSDDPQGNASGSAGDRQEGQGNSSSGQEDMSKGGYRFEVNGVELGVDMNMNDLLPRLGEAKSVFEAPSCAAEGISYTYSYAGFEIQTYPDGANNLISYIILKDDTVSTPEGIDLSKTRADIVKAYGEGGVEGDNQISYAKDGMKLNFIFKGEDMVSIEYVSGVMF